MNYRRLSSKIVIAADASGRVSFAPSTTAEVWKLEEIAIVPNETSTAHASNYADLTLKKGSTAIATVRSTNSGTGSTMTQGTGEVLAITGAGANLEATLAAPIHLLVDATPGTGVAVDIQVQAVFSVKR